VSTTHPLARIIETAAEGRYPVADGGWSRLPTWRSGLQAVIAFTGHAVFCVEDDVSDARIRELSADGYGGATNAYLMTAIAGAGGWVGSHDALMVARGTGPQNARAAEPDTNALVLRPDLAGHSRVEYARRTRDELQVFGFPDKTREAVLMWRVVSPACPSSATSSSRGAAAGVRAVPSPPQDCNRSRGAKSSSRVSRRATPRACGASSRRASRRSGRSNSSAAQRIFRTEPARLGGRRARGRRRSRGSDSPRAALWRADFGSAESGTVEPTTHAAAARRDDLGVDRATLAIYERHASDWALRRGAAADDLGARFRATVGGGRVLDAGCGVGRYLDQLGPPAVGMDVTAAMLEIARRASTSPLVRADLEALPFADATFAGIYARHSYLHLPKPRFAAAMGEARRVLARGGSLLLTMIAGDGEGPSLAGDDFPGRWYSLWRAPELEEALSSAGFIAVETSTVEGKAFVDLLVNARRP